uniref:Glycosyltransferase family 92 protein n=1 Tax=Panagrellus redivivus TaxID=6233 RepID=A0A7E4VR58_PANRE
MVLLFNSQKGWPPKQFLQCKSIGSNETEKDLTTKTEIQPVKYMAWAVGPCAWAPYILVCPVVENPANFAISDLSYFSNEVAIPHRKAVTENLGLVACFSPLFYFERWQVMFPSLEIYRQFGISRQVYYLQSIREEIYDLLMAYKRTGAVDVETWSTMELGDSYDGSEYEDPNTELEWRNQAGAHTDCYLKYRESAEFILISDIDDVLIPRHHEHYLDELHMLLAQHPMASGFSYVRFNTAFQSERGPFGFSLNNELESARISMIQREDGKSFVRTKAVETVWIHWPATVKKDYKMVTTDDAFNFMVHLRNWTASSEPKSINVSSLLYKTSLPLHNFIRSERLAELSKESKDFIETYAKAEFAALPADSVYYKLIEQCYNDMFYSKGRQVTTCPGPARCKFPNNLKGIGCAIANSKTKHELINRNVVVHQMEDEKHMIIKADGCQ